MGAACSFRVRIEVSAGRDPAEPGALWLRGLATLADCQRAYVEAREWADLGASQFGTGEVFDRFGQHVASISYNGRLWPPVPWHSGLVPLAEAPPP